MLLRKFKTHRLMKLLRFWPPYLGAGVRVTRASDAFNELEVEMRQRWWNTNYVGTHFGGSLYSMVDPFYMFILIEGLGPDYIVWDKAASIRFRRPGKGTVRARFHVPPERLAEIKAAADAQDKVEPTFTVEIRDESGEVVTIVEKLLYVRRKDRSAPAR